MGKKSKPEAKYLLCDMGEKIVLSPETVTRMHAITYRRTIDFDDIVASCEVVPDEHCTDPPWEDCDGYEHELVTASHWWDDERKCSVWRGNPRYIVGEHYDRRLIVIDPRQVEKWGIYDYWRALGQSKQVAREMTAREVARTYEQLRRWYVHGWESWGVTCEFLGVEESLWGFDDEECAAKEGSRDVAHEVACGLEKLGFLIVNNEEAPVTTETKRDRLRDKIARQLWFEDAKEYAAWLARKQ